MGIADGVARIAGGVARIADGVAQKTKDKNLSDEIAEYKGEVSKHNKLIETQLVSILKNLYDAQEPEIFDVHITLMGQTNDGFNVTAKVRKLKCDFGEQEGIVRASVNINNSLCEFSDIELTITNVTFNLEDLKDAILPKIKRDHQDKGSLLEDLPPSISQLDKSGVHYDRWFDSKKNYRHIRFHISLYRIDERINHNIHNVTVKNSYTFSIGGFEELESIPHPDEKEILKHILKDKKIIKQVARDTLKTMGNKISLPSIPLPSLLKMDNEISVSPNFPTGKINFCKINFCVESYFWLKGAKFAVSHDFEYEIQEAKVGSNSKRLDFQMKKKRDIRLIV